MSGRYQHRFGFEHNSGPERYASPEFGQPREVPTLAEKLKAAGYATGMIGKWHIGFKEGLRPHERGFDSHYGFLSGARSFYPDSPRETDPIVRNGVPVTDETDYLTDAFAREAVSFIERASKTKNEEPGTKNTAQPWFLYFAFNAVHSPLEATEAYEARFPHITDPKRKTYAGMLSALDDAVCRVMEKVRELGQEENTLVMFYSDNGGPTAETSSRNDPLRGFKGQMYEGGIRVPFVMQWKGTIPAGMTYTQPVMGFDCHATALAAAKVDWASAQTNGDSAKAETTLDGVNLLPHLLGETTAAPHEFLCWRAGAQCAIRLGDWKLVQTPREGTAQLFNLKTDLGETTDLAAKEHAKLAELTTRFAEWETGTIPAKWIRQDQRNAEPGGEPKSGPGGGPMRRPANPAAPGSRVDEAFNKADANNDGQLTREEYPQKEVFDTVDANRDGNATLEEVRAYYQKRRTAPKQ